MFRIAIVSTLEMIYSNFSFPKHFKQYLKIRNSQTFKTYLLCGCRPPLWWIEISIANTELWSLPVSLYIQCIRHWLVIKYQNQMSEFDWSKRPISNELFRLVKKDQDRIQMGGFDWSKRPRSNSNEWVWLVKKTPYLIAVTTSSSGQENTVRVGGEPCHY